MYTLVAIFVLCLLIVVHEAGHMVVARWFGMRVERFSIFFGPPLLRWRGRTTTYQLATIPLGGFVQIAGMNPHEKIDPEDDGSYANKSVWARFATIAAGPATNYLFAMLLVWFLMLFWGAPKSEILSTIQAVSQGRPAAQAGVRAGDRVVSVNGQAIQSGTELIRAINNSGGQPLRLEVQRGQSLERIIVTPQAEGESFLIGIALVSRIAFTQVSPQIAIWMGLIYPFQESARILSGLKRLVIGKASTEQVGGIIEVVKQLKSGFQQSLATAFLLTAMLNVFLGLFNLLPIPALDGGRLVFLLFNIFTGRPANQRFETIVHMVGFILLMGLLLLVNFRDIVRWIGG